MENSNRLFKFITYGNFSDDNINYLKSSLNKTNNQVIRDLFKILKSLIKDYNNSEYFNELINNNIKLINIFCSKQIFNDEEIEINRKRIKSCRKELYNILNNKNNEALINSINLLDEIVLERNVDTSKIIPFIEKLIDNQEDINIIKKFINTNKEAITKNVELFDYIFYKAIACMQDSDRDIYYYITLLKISYNSKLNKKKYLASLQMINNKFANEINYIINGIKRPFTPEEVLDKYGIIYDLADHKIFMPYKKTISDKIITIDNNNTFLRDDAISIKKDGNKYIVSIHVADVASEIEPNSESDYDARNNYKCLYIPGNRTSMFSANIENKLSLNSGKIRRVISLDVVLNDSGDILDYSISKNNIVVTNNLSYSESDRIINYLSENEFYHSLNELYMLSRALEYRNKNKAEYWEKKEKANNDKKDYDYKSDMIISELMVLYNRILAQLAFDNNNPYIYRIQENEYISSLLSDLGIENTGKIKNIMNALYLDSKYSSKPSNHAGLGLSKYSHSSDPLRRYPDLYNQYLMHEFYFKDMHGIYDKETIDNLVNYFNQRNRELSLMKLEYNRALELKKQNS